jgi:leucyl aminopeptidase
VERLAREQGWAATFLDEAQLRGRRAGAFLAVSQGSANRDAGILHLRHLPGAKGAKPQLALVGKGICFDTGGVNVKSARYMHGMHEDMAGSAVALATFLALSLLDVDFPVDCWLALAENHIGPNAYKPNDVVTASNGTTIEVIHTDAEGRMVLADTLALASRTRPRLILDFATLTGACVHALSTRYSGALTNRDALLPAILAAGRDSGERVWPFPMDADFDEDLESRAADIKQCSLENEADQILAARFLSRFVGEEIDWVHVDLSAANRKGGLGAIATDVTGFGVRFALQFTLDQWQSGVQGETV